MNGRCDIEVGKPGAWRVCGRKAHWQRCTAHGSRLQFCLDHAHLAHNPTTEHYEAAPNSEAEHIGLFGKESA